jgi:hypothetical protein
MSASKTSYDVLGLSLLASDVPSDYAALTDAILAFYDEVRRDARRLSVIYRSGRGKQRAFRAKSFRETMLDEETLDVSVDVGENNVDEHKIKCFLRPRDFANQEFETRWVTLTATGLNLDDKPVRALLGSLIELYPIAHGGIAKYRSLQYAAKECSWSGSVSGPDLGEATYERLREDQMLSGRLLRKLRRLYPVTIVGPNLWSELPPLPTVEPTPRVDDVGNCKLIMACPELVEPRDPAFLAGTVELRRWLWPFTVQNKYDAVDKPE